MHHIAHIPPLSPREAAEDALKQINHEMCMRLLETSETNARRAAMLFDIAPELHDQLVQEVLQINGMVIGDPR